MNEGSSNRPIDRLIENNYLPVVSQGVYDNFWEEARASNKRGDNSGTGETLLERSVQGVRMFKREQPLFSTFMMRNESIPGREYAPVWVVDAYRLLQGEGNLQGIEIPEIRSGILLDKVLSTILGRGEKPLTEEEFYENESKVVNFIKRVNPLYSEFFADSLEGLGDEVSDDLLKRADNSISIGNLLYIALNDQIREGSWPRRTPIIRPYNPIELPEPPILELPQSPKILLPGDELFIP